MSFTRREFGKLALVGLPAAAALSRSETIFGAFAQPKPNSFINGVQVGTITYSYRSMPDQSADATLKYIVDSGISAIELMGGPVESYAGAPTAGRGGGAGRAGAGPGGGAGARGPGGERAASDPQNLPQGTNLGEWHGQQCAVPIEGGDPAAPGGGRGGGGGGRGRGQQTPEEQAAQQEQAAKMKAWRTSVS